MKGLPSIRAEGSGVIITIGSEVVPLHEEHEQGIELFVFIHNAQQIAGVLLSKDLRDNECGETRVWPSVGLWDVHTDRTYLRAGCRRSLSCSWATNSNSDGFRGSPPKSL